MNIYDYMDQYGCYSFEEKPINEVDCVIFSFLSYADFDHIVENKKISLKDVGRMHLGLHKKGEKNVMAVREATKMLTYMKDTKRYRLFPRRLYTDFCLCLQTKLSACIRRQSL